MITGRTSWIVVLTVSHTSLNRPVWSLRAVSMLASWSPFFSNLGRGSLEVMPVTVVGVTAEGGGEGDRHGSGQIGASVGDRCKSSRRGSWFPSYGPPLPSLLIIVGTNRTWLMRGVG